MTATENEPMSGSRVQWIVLGVIVLGLAVLGIALGMNLVPPRAVATERGTVAGWWVIWTVISLATLMALTVAGFLFAAGLGKVPETRNTSA
jgi:MFS family permease